MWNSVYPTERQTSIPNMVIRELFLSNQSINIINPTEKNMFTIPNHEEKWDYYANPCLSQLKDELQFQKW